MSRRARTGRDLIAFAGFHERFSKKVLTLKPEIEYQREWFQNG
jgi:hypothetical protein